MEIFGIGSGELLFVIVLALIVLGPKDMQKAGRTIGRWLNALVRSDGWKAFQQTSREIRSLPTKLMREANLELMEVEKDLRHTIQAGTPSYRPSPRPTSSQPRPQPAETTPQPPSATPDNDDPLSNEKTA
jgi:sec-independent protein translocase protein TatB